MILFLILYGFIIYDDFFIMILVICRQFLTKYVFISIHGIRIAVLYKQDDKKNKNKGAKNDKTRSKGKKKSGTKSKTGGAREKLG